MAGPKQLAIRNGKIVTPNGVLQGDLRIEDGKITQVGGTAPKADHSIDADGKWVLPGGVDPHCHIEQISGMGLMSADTFDSATRSAAMGGTTSVISFAAQAAGEPLAQTMASYGARAKAGARIDHAFHLIIRDTDVPDFGTDLAKLIPAGHRSIKIFTTYAIKLEDPDILTVLRAARASGAVVCVHAENDALIAEAKARLVREGKLDPPYHAESHPRMAEIEAIERMCRFAEYLHQPVMIFHVSTAEGVEAVRQAKARGVPVRAETCPHYLFMTETVLDGNGVAPTLDGDGTRPPSRGIEGAKWMCSPPQRTAADQQALWAGLQDGTLDLVSSDHAPFRFDETGKLAAGPQPGFHEIANGLPGLETRLPLMFDAMVSKGRLGIETFVQLTSTVPAQLYGLKGKGQLREGFDGDVVIWDPEKTVTYGQNDLHDNVGYNPWEGYTVKGWPEHVIQRGAPIVRDGECLAKPGDGQWLPSTEPDWRGGRRSEAAE